MPGLCIKTFTVPGVAQSTIGTTNPAQTCQGEKFQPKAISANRLKRESRWVALDSQRISHLPLSSSRPPMPPGLPAKCCTLQVVLVDLFL